MKYIKIFVAGAALTIAACSGGSIGGIDAERSYSIALTSTQQVPAPKPTTAAGSAEIIVYASEIQYQLSAGAITGVTLAHIHSGVQGSTGQIVTTLFQHGTGTGLISGLFASGTLTASSLSGTTIESLKTLLASGNAYVDVHTTANPSGEIRGQIK